MKPQSIKLPEAKTSGAAAADPILDKLKERTIETEPDTFDDEEIDVPMSLSPLEEVMAHLEDAAMGGSMGKIVAEMPVIIARDGAGEMLVNQLSRLRLCTERAHAIALEAFQAAKH